MKNNNNKIASVFAYPQAMAEYLGVSKRMLAKWRKEGRIQESSYFENGVSHVYHMESAARDLLTWPKRQKASHGRCPDCICALEKSA